MTHGQAIAISNRLKQNGIAADAEAHRICFSGSSDSAENGVGNPEMSETAQRGKAQTVSGQKLNLAQSMGRFSNNLPRVRVSLEHFPVDRF